MRVALLGTGNMGKALVAGLSAMGSDVTTLAFDVIEGAREGLPESVRVVEPAAWFSAENNPDVIILAVKPAAVAAASASLSSLQQGSSLPSPLWVSIAAGIGIATIAESLPPHSRICRVMPNTPAMVGEGMSAFACNEHCSDDDTLLVERILVTCGKAIAVPEKLLHAVTGLSGSGPAFVYLFIEALIEGGITAGLPLDIARTCAVQTVLGAAKMVQQTGEHPGVLKNRVMSPGGTTVAGLFALEKKAFSHAVIQAVGVAAKRSEQLAG